MAPNRHFEIPPSVSSSQEDEDEVCFSEENGYQELVKDQGQSTLQSNLPFISVLDQIVDSDSDQSLGSPNEFDFTIRPIIPKPMTDPTILTKKSDSKSGSKRSSKNEPTDLNSKSKKKKKTSIVDDEKHGDENLIESISKSKKKKKITSNLDDNDDECVKNSYGMPLLEIKDEDFAILKSMVEYRFEIGSVSDSYMDAFHDFIQKYLHIVVSKNDLVSKIKRLKKKYINKLEKGESSVIYKAHENECFDLSKKIWGNSDDAAADNDVDMNKNGMDIAEEKEKQNCSSSKVNVMVTNDDMEINSMEKNCVEILKPKPITLGLPKQDGMKKTQNFSVVSTKPKQNMDSEKVEVGGDIEKSGVDDFWSDYPYLKESLEKKEIFAFPDFLKKTLVERLPTIGRDKAKEMNNKWKKLEVEEAEIFLKKYNLFQEQACLVLDELKSSIS